MDVHVVQGRPIDGEALERDPRSRERRHVVAATASCGVQADPHHTAVGDRVQPALGGDRDGGVTQIDRKSVVLGEGVVVGGGGFIL